MDYTEINKNRKIANPDLYREVAEEHGVTEDLVQAIANAQSQFTVKVVRMGAFENVIYPYLGKVKVNPRRVQTMATRQMKK